MTIISITAGSASAAAIVGPIAVRSIARRRSPETDATKALTKMRRQWFNKRKSVAAMLREVIYNQPVQLLDSDADNKMVDADLALQALGGDHVAFGYLTTTITVSDTDRARADEKVRAVERIINGLGFTTIREGINAVEAWLGSLPGHVYANVRQPIVHTLNLAHLMPLSSVWAGPVRNAHLDGPPLLYAETSGSTPFRLSTHIGDVGHMLIVGPTGAGKSVLLALLALQFRRYPGAQVYVFDKGFSARAAVLAMGGAHHALGLGGDHDDEARAIAFQPLRHIDRGDERAWACGLMSPLPSLPARKSALRCCPLGSRSESSARRAFASAVVVVELAATPTGAAAAELALAPDTCIITPDSRAALRSASRRWRSASAACAARSGPAGGMVAPIAR